VPQVPLERFNLWVSEKIKRAMPHLPLHGQAALDRFPELDILRTKHDEIRRELARVLHAKSDIPELKDLHPRDASISSPEWKTYVFKLWGHEVPENMEACPETVKAFSAVPGVHTALYSILDPRSRIPAHRGWAAGVVRVHYPLIVPNPPDDCRMRIESNWYAWHEREPLLFDDTREHEVRNDTDQMRVVLIIDFEPRLSLFATLYCKLRYFLVRNTAEIRTIRERASRAVKGGTPQAQPS
jgi:beta-hydroxylase